MKPIDAAVAQNREIRGIQRGRLFRRYFLLILALVCGALLISGAVSLYFSYQENKVALSSVQREKALGAAVRIEQFVRQIEQQLVFAALPQLGAGGIEQRELEFYKLQRLVPAITDTAQIDARGREQLAVSRLGMNVVGSGIDRSADPAFRGPRPGATWFGPVTFRRETEPYMAIAVRASGDQGAVTVADVNLKFIWDVVTRIKIGRKGKAYVVDGTGHLVADPDIGLVLRKTNLASTPQVQYALQAGAAESMALEVRSAEGASVLTAYATIEPPGQRVVTVDGQQFLPSAPEKRLYPVHFSRECGQEYHPFKLSSEGTERRFLARDEPLRVGEVALDEVERGERRGRVRARGVRAEGLRRGGPRRDHRDRDAPGADRG